MKSCSNIWIGSNGRNGKNIAAIVILNTSPKSALRAIFIYFIMFPYTFLPSITPSYITVRLCFSIIMSLASLAIDVAVFTDIPTSALAKLGASLTPSPI